MKNHDEPSLFSDEFQSENQTEEIKLGSDAEDTVFRDLASYPDATQEEVMRRYYFIEWMRKELAGGWTQKNLDPLLDRAANELQLKAPKWRTLADWWKIYSQSGFKLISLVPKKTAGNRSLKVRNEMVFFDKALKRYLVPERPSIAAVYRYYSDVIRIENQNIVGNKIEALSYNGFYNRIKKLPAYDVKVARHGKYLADMEFNNINAHYPASRVLEKVEIDHTPLDLILLDDKHHFPIGRPYLTLLIDQFSRCIVGFYLGFKEPSYFSVMKALLNAIKPKNYISEQFPNIEKEWCCEGKMESLVVDNGAEFWSKSLEQACLELGIHIQYNPVRKPWLKPLVERTFRTINSKLTVSIPGKTFSNILQREEYDSKKDAVMHFSTFNEILHKWIIDVYHHEADSRKRSIPYLKWQEGINYLPPISYSPEDEKQLVIILGLKAKRQHRRGGIYIHRLRYDSEILANYRKMYPSATKVLTKTNPDDISYIYVFIEHERKYVKVPCVAPKSYIKGLSLFQHQVNLKFERDYIEKKEDSDSLAEGRMYINDRILKEVDELKNRQKKATKGISRLAKYSGIGSDKKESIGTSSPLKVMKDADKTKPVLPNNDDWDDLISDLEPY